MNRNRGVLFYANGGYIELYDLENDPYEMIDLADKAEFAPVAAELSDKGKDWFWRGVDGDWHTIFERAVKG